MEAITAGPWRKRFDKLVAALRESPSPRHGLEPFYRYWGTRLIERMYRPAYHDFDRLPTSGGALLVCNHVSYVDGLILSAGSSRPIRYVIDEDIYRLPGVHHFMVANRAIPVKPTKESVGAMIAAVCRALADGDLVCIFPEGQLSATGSLSRFRPGIEWILARTQVPVYPLALKGLWGSFFSRRHKGTWRRFQPFRKRKRVSAICGAPLPPNDVTARRLQQEVLRLKYRLPD